jgi:hypothetical protein
MMNFEWDIKECVLDAESGSQVRSRFHQKKSQKNEKRRCGKAGIHELLTAFLPAGQSCAIKLGFASDYGGRFLRVSSGEKISSSF